MKKIYTYTLLILLGIIHFTVCGDNLVKTKILNFYQLRPDNNTDIKELLTAVKSNKLSENDKIEAYIQFLNKMVYDNNRWYIENVDIINILIAGLSANNDGIRKTSARLLSENALQRDIDIKSKQIFIALNLNDLFVLIKNQENILPKYGDYLMLIGRLTLSNDEKNIIFKCEQIPLCVKAKMKDSQAEKAIINAFNLENDYHKKSNLAKQLGYIASPKTIEALLKGLSSEVQNEWQYGKVSVRCDIIYALRQALPEEDLFKKSLDQFAVGKFSQTIDRDEARKKYAEDINKWASDHYKIKVWDPEAVWFKYSYDTPIIYSR